MHLFKTLFVFILMVTVAGCNNPKEANKQNFRKAINAELEEEPVILSYQHLGLDGSFPQILEVERGPVGTWKDLEEVGIISLRDTTVKKSGLWNKEIEKDAFVIELTSKGQKHKVEASSYFDESGFRVADQKVNKITNYTIPESSVDGVKRVRVKYTTKLENIVPWGDQFVDLESFEAESKTTLKLTNNGWQKTL
jgi:hypothetical protein